MCLTADKDRGMCVCMYSKLLMNALSGLPENLDCRQRRGAGSVPRQSSHYVERWTTRLTEAFDILTWPHAR